MKFPCWKYETSSDSGIDSMISTLYFSPRERNRSIASARETTCRSNGRFSATILRISSSMRAASSGANGSVSKS